MYEPKLHFSADFGELSAVRLCARTYPFRIFKLRLLGILILLREVLLVSFGHPHYYP